MLNKAKHLKNKGNDMKSSYVYILTNKSNTTLYIGVTNDIVRRVTEHKNEMVDGFTKKYKINKLIHLEEFSNIYDAITREKQLKGWTRQKKIELINETNPEWKDLSFDL